MAKNDDQPTRLAAASSAADEIATHGPGPQAQPAGLVDHGNGGAQDLPLDPETAVRIGFWGWRWTSIAAEAGRLMASTYALPGEDEVKAQGFAKAFPDITPVLVELAGGSDILVSKAMVAFQASLPLLHAARATRPIPEQLWRATKHAMYEAERLGRSAAKAERLLMLVSREQGGVH